MRTGAFSGSRCQAPSQAAGAQKGGVTYSGQLRGWEGKSELRKTAASPVRAWAWALCRLPCPGVRALCLHARQRLLASDPTMCFGPAPNPPLPSGLPSPLMRRNWKPLEESTLSHWGSLAFFLLALPASSRWNGLGRLGCTLLWAMRMQAPGG